MTKPLIMAGRLRFLNGFFVRQNNLLLPTVPTTARTISSVARPLCSSATLTTVPGCDRSFWLQQKSPSTTKVGSGRRFLSSKQENGSLKLVYVHPLSQLVLEVLQSDYSDWLVRRELHHNSLTFHRDGTFEIKVPAQPQPTPDETAEGSLSSVQLASSTSSRNSSSSSSSNRAAVTAAAIAASANPASEQQQSHRGTFNSQRTKPRIWTSFDEHEKKHWLTVQTGSLVGRYMLQDNLMSAWQGNRKGSLPLRIQQAVNEMVGAIEKFEASPMSKR